MSASKLSSPPSLVTVVIPTFNREADVRRALHNLSEQAGPSLSVIVVDNSSTDGTADMVAAQQVHWGERLRYVRKPPEGPASARNVGLSKANSPFVLFHDSDVELEPEWIVRATQHLQQDDQLAAVGGHIVYAFDPHRVNAYGGDLSWLGLAWDVSEGAPLAEQGESAKRIWINCSAMLVRRLSVLDAGAFDERFFYGFEDTDLGWRLRILGLQVKVVPELIARHHVDPDPGSTHPQIVFHYCKNRLRMLLRNVQTHRTPWVWGGYLLYSAVDLLLRSPRRPKWQALVWNLRHLPETWALRRTMQRQRVQSDAQIFACASGKWFPPTRLGGNRRRPVSGVASLPGLAKRSASDDRV